MAHSITYTTEEGQMNIDFFKYKRFFAFGCSFTKYHCPSWSDLISKEMPNAEYVNFGLPGSGNTLISYRIAEANSRYTFNDTDLIMVMWTSFCREDKWFDSRWHCSSNIFNQSLYDQVWVDKFADPAGYMIRDLAVIELTQRYLKSLPCTSIFLSGFPLTFTDIEIKSDKINPSSAYSKLIYNSLPSLYSLEFNNQWEDDWEIDGHPTTLRYFNYLKKLNINMSSTTKKYALEKTGELLKCKTFDSAVEIYKNEYEHTWSNFKHYPLF